MILGSQSSSPSLPGKHTSRKVLLLHTGSTAATPYTLLAVATPCIQLAVATTYTLLAVGTPYIVLAVVTLNIMLAVATPYIMLGVALYTMTSATQAPGCTHLVHFFS